MVFIFERKSDTERKRDWVWGRGSGGGKVGEEEKEIFYILVYPPNGYNSQGKASKAKPGSQNSIQVFNNDRMDPSTWTNFSVFLRILAWGWIPNEVARFQPVLIWYVGITGVRLTSCATTANTESFLGVCFVKNLDLWSLVVCPCFSHLLVFSPVNSLVNFYLVIHSLQSYLVKRAILKSCINKHRAEISRDAVATTKMCDGCLLNH